MFATTTQIVQVSNLSDVTFGIAILITLNCLGLVAYIYNTISVKKKPWQK